MSIRRSACAALALLSVQQPSLVLADIGHHDELCPMEMRPLMLKSKDGSPDRRLSVDADTVVLVPSATQGPFFQTVDDYYESTSLVEAGYSTGPGMTADRASVVDLVRLNITFNVYSVSGNTAEELVGATLYLWGADGLGRYSAVSDSQLNGEDTSGTKWMRSKYPTDSNGQVTMHAAIPGWYQGRVMHFHVRIGLPSDSTSFAITTQLFFDQDEIGTALKARSPYSAISASMTSLDDDTVYPNMDSSTRDSMILSLTGSMDAGYTATFNLGIDSSNLGSTDSSSTSDDSTSDVSTTDDFSTDSTSDTSSSDDSNSDDSTSGSDGSADSTVAASASGIVVLSSVAAGIFLVLANTACSTDAM
mmetsp:Transcript_81556/g.170577  ORF Transcript_81556/g.170577 Transcript_81556/m.170577 type:complete len:362 (-) Transcript_81556:435-1520(-)